MLEFRTICGVREVDGITNLPPACDREATPVRLSQAGCCAWCGQSSALVAFLEPDQAIAHAPNRQLSSVARRCSHIEEVHRTQHQCRNSDIPTKKAHELSCGLDCPGGAQSQGDETEIDEVETHNEQMAYTGCQLSIMAKSSDQIYLAIGAKGPPINNWDRRVGRGFPWGLCVCRDA